MRHNVVDGVFIGRGLPFSTDNIHKNKIRTFRPPSLAPSGNFGHCFPVFECNCSSVRRPDEGFIHIILLFASEHPVGAGGQ